MSTRPGFNIDPPLALRHGDARARADLRKLIQLARKSKPRTARAREVADALRGSRRQRY